MSLFDGLKRKKELSKLKKILEKNPTSIAYKNYIERCLAYDEIDEGKKYVGLALEQFPESENLQSLNRTIMKNELGDKIIMLKKDIEEKQNPRDYARLGFIYYKDLKNLNKALEFSRDGLEKYPENEDLHLLNAEIRYHRFLIQNTSNDALKAEEHLLKAISLNKMNYKALNILGDLYAKVGAFGRARKMYESILSFANDDSKIKEKLAELAPVTDEDKPFAKYVKEYERNTIISIRKSDNNLESIVSDEDFIKFGEKLVVFEELEGFKAAVLFVANEDKRFAHTKDKSLDEDEYSLGITKYFSTSFDASLKMDIGALNNSIIRTEDSIIVISQMKNFGLSLLLSGKQNENKLLMKIEGYLGEILQDNG